MNIVQITPGAGGMYCGNCFRDNALVAALKRAGHSALMVPLYLPLTLEDEDQSRNTPIFFSGVNVFLEQKSKLFNRTPAWLHRWLASPWLLRRLAARTGRTHPARLGELTLSMIRGEEGKQRRELGELIRWLKQHPQPDVICLSNALLMGLVRSLRQELGVPVACMLQGEDSFLDSLPGPYREEAWSLLAERGREVDLYVAPSRYFARHMGGRLGLDSRKVTVVPNGINLEGFQRQSARFAAPTQAAPVIGYFARMCREKGLDLLVEAFIRLRRRGRAPGVRLRIGGGCGPGDRPFVQSLEKHLKREGLGDAVTFHPNLDRQQKIEFLHSLSLFSVPATYGEAFGLYVLEALAAGVPVVQPDEAAFPELIEATGGGLLFKTGHPESLADALESLLLDPARRRRLAEEGRQRVLASFGVHHMMENMVAAYGKMLDSKPREDQARLVND